MGNLSIDVLAEDPRWELAGLEALAQRVLPIVLAASDIPDGDWEVSILACDDERIAVLNTEFRAKPTPTNVLSWPADELGPEIPGGTPDLPSGEDPCLGDIAVSYDTCAREAADQGLTFEAHITHLLVHGVLHLLGYDHIDDKDADKMEALEVSILATLGVADPY